MKARDLSIISTPPPNRYPIETEVIRFNEELIRNAINYEISRGRADFFCLIGFKTFLKFQIS